MNTKKNGSCLRDASLVTVIAVAAVAVAVHLYIMSGSKHWIFDSLHWLQTSDQ